MICKSQGRIIFAKYRWESERGVGESHKNAPVTPHKGCKEEMTSRVAAGASVNVVLHSVLSPSHSAVEMITRMETVNKSLIPG